MRATLNIPDQLIKDAMKLTGNHSKTKTIVVALEEYVKRQKIKGLLAMRGKMDLDYDWEKERELELKLQAEREALFDW